MTDFSNIDRLIEFGMGMSLARQMVNTMNNTMNNMQVAGVNAQSTGNLNQQCGTACAPINTSKWYVAIDDHMAGPLTEEEVSTLISRGNILNHTLLWCQGMQSWSMAQDIPEINKLLLLN